tara:strand:+ start:1301 stop:1600 length:300 start_codon:yes stop_codon:yes gene_type:complete
VRENKIFKFNVGDEVLVLDHDPPGHIRTPSYLRGKKGIIEFKHGIFRDPEKLALGKPGLPKRALYLVKFKQKDVWDSYNGPENDTIAADIYEHWLKLYN